MLKLDNPVSMKRLGGRTHALVFPSPPLKFRTPGFPQYGFKLRFRGDLRQRTEPPNPCLIRRDRFGSQPPMARAGKQAALFPESPQSRGPWLASGFCCLAGSRLTMASSAPLIISRQLMSSSTGLCPRADNERVPNLLRVSVLVVPPSEPRRTERLHSAVASPLTLAFVLVAGTRHPHVRALRFRRGCVTRLQSSLHAAARRIASLAPA